MESLASNGTSSIIQSKLNGDSTSETLRSLAINVGVGAIGNLGAKQIGRAAHGSVATDANGNVLRNADGSIIYTKPSINKLTQLTLHAGLGATTATLTGNDALSGAVSGLVGELTAERIGTSGLTDEQIVQVAGLTGGLSAIATGSATGQSDEEIADNIFSGKRIGSNAAQNNYLMPKEKRELVRELDACNGDATCQGQVQAKYEKISEPRDSALNKSAAKCLIGNCAEFKSINESLRLKVSTDGNEYYGDNKDEFVILPKDKSIYHTYQVGENDGIDLLGQADYKKYVHPVMGYEVVVDSNDNIVTDHLNMGTYNFYNPSGVGVNNPLIESDQKHLWFDVAPYYISGNSSQDPSAFSQRIERAFVTMPKAQIILLPMSNSIAK